MMKEKNQMSIGTDKKIEVSTSYLLIFKNALKKISKSLLLIFILMYLNIGAKYPSMSESSAAINENVEAVVAKTEYDKYVKLYQEIYEQSVIQQIEFESEIVIPSYIDFKYVEFTYKTAQYFNLSPRVAFRLMFKESSFVDTVKSKMGAQGLMQLMPDTRKKYYNELRLDTMNLDKNQEDIYIGLYYIKDLNEFWRERGNSERIILKLAIASYNAGYTNIIKYKGVPPYKETQDFVAFILRPHSNPTFYANIVKKNKNKNIS
jgi:soluble lytic murein transglycosylase-like protein